MMRGASNHHLCTFFALPYYTYLHEDGDTCSYDRNRI